MNIFTGRINSDSKEFGINFPTQIGIFILPFILTAVFYYFLFYTEYATFYKIMRKENQPVELITFIFLLVSSLFGFLLFYKLLRAGNKIISVFYFVFALGLLFVAMEEISWGQWFFKFHTPQYFRGINRQTEFNLHNIQSVNLFFEVLRVLFGIGGLVSIVLIRVRSFKYLSSPIALLSWFLLIMFYASIDLYNRFDPSHGAYFKDSFLWTTMMFTEVLELFISIAAFIYIYLNFRKLN